MTHQSLFESAARHTFRGSALFLQYAAAVRFEREQGELDAREDECWRMYGYDVQYVMDERIILDPTAPPPGRAATP